MSVDAPTEPNGDSLMHRIVTELANHTGTDHTTLAPLAESIDPDALETLLTESPETVVKITFLHEGYRVGIDSTGVLCVEQDS